MVIFNETNTSRNEASKMALKKFANSKESLAANRNVLKMFDKAKHAEKLSQARNFLKTMTLVLKEYNDDKIPARDAMAWINYNAKKIKIALECLGKKND